MVGWKLQLFFSPVLLGGLKLLDFVYHPFTLQSSGVFVPLYNFFLF